MKKLNAVYLTLLFVFAITVRAQTQTVTLTATNGLPSSFNCTSNQVITINSFIGDDNLGSYVSSALISFNNGNSLSISPYHYGLNSGSTSLSGGGTGVAVAGNAFFTGVTNISVSSYGGVSALTFTITTPSVQSSIPANAVVIPTDATGPVQIVLESSSDLLNWTSSLPGTYGSTYTNRFFRVRAIVQ